MRDKSSRPEIAAPCSNLADYDTIFLAFPIWWYVAPMIINTFLESGDFSGGLKLREGSVEVNCTVDTLLALSRNSLDAEIAAILFD